MTPGPESPTWQYVACMPSVEIPRTVRGGGLAALSPDSDAYQEVVRSTNGLSDYLESFTTAFGVQLCPTILASLSGNRTISAEPLAWLRNSIAVAAVFRSKLDTWHTERIDGPPCSDLFDIPGVNLAQNGSRVYISSGFEMGLHDLNKFTGQGTESYINPQHLNTRFDEQLLSGLERLLDWNPANRLERARQFRVMRSLEMAAEAMRSPFIHFGTQQEQGVRLALWVSAFETLAHPGKGHVSFSHVSDMIKAVPWCLPRLTYRKFKAIDVRKSGYSRTPIGLTTLPVQVYGRLFRTRNRYLHGDNLPKGKIEQGRKSYWGNLGTQVPLLYRSVVLSALFEMGHHEFASRPDWPEDDANDETQTQFGERLQAFYEQQRYELPIDRREP